MKINKSVSARHICANMKSPFEGKKVIFVPDDKAEMNADGRRGYLKCLDVTDDLHKRFSYYERYVKRGLDLVVSLGGLILLFPVCFLAAAAVFSEDPGPVLFIQTRVGADKKFFKMHKFRSMKRSAPHHIPTHMMKHPEYYVTRTGYFLRRFSLDELPQLWDILLGNMSFVGPRPALWNQESLIAERDKYGANDIRPGLTGLAQINGRDELEIIKKAEMDGVYADILKKGGINAFFMDVKCFYRTLGYILKERKAH